MMPGEEPTPEAYRSMGQGDPFAPGPDVPPWLRCGQPWGEFDTGHVAPLVDASGWLRGVRGLFSDMTSTGLRPFELESPSCPRHPHHRRVDCPCQSSAELTAAGLLPTYPGTQLEFAARAWPLCRWCRVLVALHLWRLRDRHIARRHPSHPDAPFGLFQIINPPN